MFKKDVLNLLTINLSLYLRTDYHVRKLFVQFISNVIKRAGLLVKRNSPKADIFRWNSVNRLTYLCLQLEQKLIIQSRQLTRHKTLWNVLLLKEHLEDYFINLVHRFIH